MKTVENKIVEITNTLLKTSVNKCGFEGCRGTALFLLLYSISNDSEVIHDRSIELIEQELSYFNNHIDNLSFWTGISGLGWYCNAIIKRYIDLEYDSGFDVLDEMLVKYMLNCNDFDIFKYDYLHGSLGIGHYYLSESKETALVALVEKIQETSIDDNQIMGKKWKSNTKHKKEYWDYNISLSHGMSSIIVMLSKIYQKGIEQEKCARLIEGAVNYILSQKLPKGRYNSIFPNFALESMENLLSSRLAWCYGDLGIAVALWHASQALGRKDWEQEVRDIMLHASKRRNLQENGVIDACFCHGTSGIAHIFNRMYHYTGMPECKEDADIWIEITLEMAKFEEGASEYKTRHGEDKGFENEYGLLEGIAGIGLALLSYISDIEPTWDECLLLS